VDQKMMSPPSTLAVLVKLLVPVTAAELHTTTTKGTQEAYNHIVDENMLIRKWWNHFLYMWDATYSINVKTKETLKTS